MHKLSFLTEHCSIPAKQLTDPAPSELELKSILQAAMSAPDHGQLRPFRFLIIRGDARQQLSQVFEQAARLRGADEATVLKQLQKPLRAPVIIVVIARITHNPAIPDIEQLLSAAVAAQHIQLACRALNYGSIWVTGENSYDLNVYEALGLNVHERVIGFIYTGSVREKSSAKIRADSKTITSFWNAPHHTDFSI